MPLLLLHAAAAAASCYATYSYGHVEALHGLGHWLRLVRHCRCYSLRFRHLHRRHLTSLPLHHRSLRLPPLLALPPPPAPSPAPPAPPYRPPLRPPPTLQPPPAVAPHEVVPVPPRGAGMRSVWL